MSVKCLCMWIIRKPSYSTIPSSMDELHLRCCFESRIWLYSVLRRATAEAVPSSIRRKKIVSRFFLLTPSAAAIACTKCSALLFFFRLKIWSVLAVTVFPSHAPNMMFVLNIVCSHPFVRMLYIITPLCIFHCSYSALYIAAAGSFSFCFFVFEYLFDFAAWSCWWPAQRCRSFDKHPTWYPACCVLFSSFLNQVISSLAKPDQNWNHSSFFLI